MMFQIKIVERPLTIRKLEKKQNKWQQCVLLSFHQTILVCKTFWIIDASSTGNSKKNIPEPRFRTRPRQNRHVHFESQYTTVNVQASLLQFYWLSPLAVIPVFNPNRHPSTSTWIQASAIRREERGCIQGEVSRGYSGVEMGMWSKAGMKIEF